MSRAPLKNPFLGLVQNYRRSKPDLHLLLMQKSLSSLIFFAHWMWLTALFVSWLASFILFVFSRGGVFTSMCPRTSDVVLARQSEFFLLPLSSQACTRHTHTLVSYLVFFSLSLSLSLSRLHARSHSSASSTLSLLLFFFPVVNWSALSLTEANKWDCRK